MTTRHFLPFLLTFSMLVNGGCARTGVSTDATPTVTATRYTVRGDSMTGLFENGDEVTVLPDYYTNHSVERNDIVIYRFANNRAPVLKQVRGVPTDTIELIATEAAVYYIAINDTIMTTSRGEPYVISQERVAMLELYITNLNGVIPTDAYLLLGNQVTGSFDSTRFGLVDGSDIIGKVVY